MFHWLGQRPTGLRVPNAGGEVLRSSDDLISIRTEESYADGLIVFDGRSERLASLGIPDDSHFRSGDNALPIRTEMRGRISVRVFYRFEQGLTRVCIPNPDCSIRRSRNDARSIGTE